jgi:spore coat polysaccharide biosynthesis predicted glycosyltransferase SpsG
VSAPRILFRADASHGLGFGHIARVCALVEEVESRGAEAVPLFSGDQQTTTSWCAAHGLRAQVGEWTTEHVVRLITNQRFAAVVIDGIPIANELAPKLHERGMRTIIIDDAGGWQSPVAAVVNHNVHAESLASTYTQARKKLLGRKYLMLRREIRRYTRGSCRPMQAARPRVIVTFGGSDPVNATSRTLDLVPDERPLELVVIAGPGFQHDAELVEAIERVTQRGHTVDLRRSPDDPGGLFSSADAAICSAGGTLGELAYLGCPAIAYAISLDQVTPARHQIRHGLIAGGRKWGDTDDATIRADLAAFLLDDAARNDQRQRALATADSDGPKRIIDEAL